MLFDAFAQFLTFAPTMWLLIGVVLGILVGVLPGISTGSLMALTLPLTYYVEPTNAVILLIAMYVGGSSGGLITATLMRIPGETSSVMTTLDGYPLARSGQPGRALGLGIATSVVGGILSWFALVALAKPVATLGLYFGPFEMFAIAILALIVIVSLSEGNFVKGLISGFAGMLVAFPGIDESSGMPRLTFDVPELIGGFSLIPVVVGLFAVGQIFSDTLDRFEAPESVEAKMNGISLSIGDYARYKWNMLRSGLIGVWFGILPGAGPTVASVVAYTTAKKLSKTPEKFGHGSEEGIVAAETANNAVTGGTLIPTITLGIPGGVTDAILLGALTIHNLSPGPMLFQRSPEVFNTIIATHLISHLAMFAVMVVCCVPISKIMFIPRYLLYPFILVVCITGVYSVTNRFFDVWVMLAFGLVGLGMERGKVPLAPFVVGLVLAPLAEGQLRAALMLSGDFSGVLQRPVSLVLLLIAGALCLRSVMLGLRRH